MAAESDALRKRLGAKVRELRTGRRWSQESLAAKAGLSYKFVGEVERGIANPTVSTLGSLASALDVAVSELFGMDKPPVAERRYPLSSSDVAAVREAKDSLDGILRKLDGTVASPRRASGGYRSRRR